ATGYNFPLEMHAQIAGKVYLDNGTTDPGVAGATVTLLDNQGNQVGQAVTGADGTYQFTGLMPGVTYTVKDVPPLAGDGTSYIEETAQPGTAGGTQTTSSISNIPLGEGVDATGYNFP